MLQSGPPLSFSQQIGVLFEDPDLNLRYGQAVGSADPKRTTGRMVLARVLTRIAQATGNRFFKGQAAA